MTPDEHVETPHVRFRPGLVYAVHDGVSLFGDYYAPEGTTAAPVVVAVHGGGWQAGDRSFYSRWGRYFAEHGIALFSIDYRLAGPGKKAFPEAVHDVRAAIRFVRGQAGQLGADPRRIALIGDSAGGHLTALVALTSDCPAFDTGYPDDPFPAESTAVSAAVPIYGVYDMVQQWQHDLAVTPRNPVVENFLGTSPLDNRRICFDASPLSYVTARPSPPAFLIVWGLLDDIVDYKPQSEAFRDALRQALFPVQSLELPAAGHFWVTDPLDEPGSLTGFVAPRILRFLQQVL